MLRKDYIGQWVSLTHNALMRKTTAYLHDFDITIKQFGVLNTLYDENRLTSRELVERLFSDSSTIMAIVDQLEKKELIRREPHLQDRRIKHLTLTDKAKKIKKELIKRVDEFDMNMLDSLSEDEIRVLKTSLQKILKFALDP